jgi:hypothetical protein
MATAVSRAGWLVKRATVITLDSAWHSSNARSAIGPAYMHYNSPTDFNVAGGVSPGSADMGALLKMLIQSPL